MCTGTRGFLRWASRVDSQSGVAENNARLSRTTLASFRARKPWLMPVLRHPWRKMPGGGLLQSSEETRVRYPGNARAGLAAEGQSRRVAAASWGPAHRLAAQSAIEKYPAHRPRW